LLKAAYNSDHNIEPQVEVPKPKAEKVDVKTLLREASATPRRVLSSSTLNAIQSAKLPQNQREPRIFCYYTNWSQKYFIYIHT
jgi:hypothetical protein